jgi:hypothetical protein
MTDLLMDRIRAHRSAPDVYDPPTFEQMADRIKELDQACAKWAEVSQSNYQRARAAEAKLKKLRGFLDEIWHSQGYDARELHDLLKELDGVSDD